MSSNPESNIAEAVGSRVLQWKGSEFLELIYFLEEKNSLELLRLFTAMSGNSQDALIEFMRCISRQDNIELRADRSGLHFEGR
jgi:hypothetical protein